MPLPYDHLGGWQDAMALYVNEQLKVVVGLISSTSSSRNPVLSCGYRLLDVNHTGGVDLSDVLATLKAQADTNKWRGPASATNQTGGPHFFRVINEQSSSWTYDYAQIIRDHQWNTAVDGLIDAEFDAPNPTTGSDGMSMRMIKAEFGNRGAGGLTLQSTNQYTISGGPGSSAANQFTGESSNNTNNSEGNAVFQANSDGTVYYKIRTSSEANYDFSRIKLGSSQQDSCSGSSGVAEGSFGVSAGDSIEVEYTKDGSVSSFNDKGYLDYLYMTSSNGAGQGIPISAYYGADTDAPYDTPTSGELKWSDFYGAAAAKTFFEIDRFNPANNSNWVTRTIAWENTEVGSALSVTPPTLGRIVFRWQNGNASTSYRGDFQLGWFAFMEGANIVRRWGFNGDVNIPSYQQSIYSPGQYTTSDPGHYGYIGEGWEYYDVSSAVTESEYENLNSSLWKEIGSDNNNNSTTTTYRWNRDTGGTPSSITGISTNHNYNNNSYLYAETSGSNTLGAYYWVRSPVFKLDDNMFTSECDLFSYQYGAYGVNCPSGECTVYLEKLNYPVYTNTLWAVGHNTGSNFSGSSWPQDYTFTFYFIDMQEFENSTGWGIYEYINGPSLGTHYTGDIQIDDTAFNARGNNQNAPITTSYPEDYHFRVTGQTNAQTTRPHNFLQRHIDGDLGWERMSVAYSTTQYQWNLDYGGTPSAGTGLSDDYSGGTGTNAGYAYAETSGTNTDGFHYYMRTNRGENYGIQRYWYFRFAGVGANCGTLNCRLLLDGEED
jgi:hypothetical protein